jgi:hypothetical protein
VAESGSSGPSGPIRIGVDTDLGDAASIHTMLVVGRGAFGRP